MKLYFCLFLLIVAFDLYALEPQLVFELADGSSKSYNLSDIQNMNFENSKANSIITIYYQKNKTISFNCTTIDSIKFENGQSNIIEMKIFKKDSDIKKINLSDLNKITFKESLLQNFETVTIGSQVWMLKNLDVDHYRNGDTIIQFIKIEDWSDIFIGGWSYFNNDPENGKIYGKLYNFWAVDDKRNLAPAGWHIPSEDEWAQLEIFLGVPAEDVYKMGDHGTIEGGALKSTGTIENGDGLWYSPNVDANNSSGFSALPAGIREEQNDFTGLGYKAMFWSSKQYFEWELGSLSGKVRKYIGSNDRNCYSVRCIKDLPPTINSINLATAQIGDTIIISGSDFGPFQGTGFVSFNEVKAKDYLSWAKDLIKVKVPLGAQTGKVIVTVYEERGNEFDLIILPDTMVIKNIEPAAFFYDEVVNIKGRLFGNLQGANYVMFNNEIVSNCTFWSDTLIQVIVPKSTQNGNLAVVINGVKSNEIPYKVFGEFGIIQIGEQTWQTQNIDVDHYQNGDPIPEVTDSLQWKNLKTGAWCYYNNNTENGKIYGKLYNYYAINDPRGFAPQGWHIPSKAEWQTLVKFLGGDKVAGGKMKKTGTTYWQEPNVDATNISGFSALPGGYLFSYGSRFIALNLEACFWSSTEYNTNNSWFYTIENQKGHILENYILKTNALSVRLIKD